MGFARLLLRAGASLGLTIVAEALWAVLRPYPDLPAFDASGEFGDPGSPPLRISVLGDSTTTGTGVDHVGEIWTRVVAERLAVDYSVRLTCFGVGGATAVDVLRHQLPKTLEVPADIVFVSIGGNDVLKGVRAARFERALEAIVAALTTHAPLVVLSGVGDLSTIPRLLPPLDGMLRARGRRFDRIHQRIADRYGAVKADQWSTASGLFRTTPGIFSADLFHPSGIGHRVWADVAWSVVRPRLGPLPDAAG